MIAIEKLGDYGNAFSLVSQELEQYKKRQKLERYILGVEQMKRLKELGVDIENDNDSALYWVRFIQRKGKHKCHHWKKSLRSAKDLNSRCPAYGHYIGMPAYTLQQVIRHLGERGITWWKCACNGLPEEILMNAYNTLCEEIKKGNCKKDKEETK